MDKRSPCSGLAMLVLLAAPRLVWRRCRRRVPRPPAGRKGWWRGVTTARATSETAAPPVATCREGEAAHGHQGTGIAAGRVDGLALTSTGSVLDWDNNIDGELGNGTSGTGSDVPVKVKLPKGAVATRIGAANYSLQTLALVHRS